MNEITSYIFFIVMVIFGITAMTIALVIIAKAIKTIRKQGKI